MTMHTAALHRRIEELELESQRKSEELHQFRLAAAEAIDKVSVFMSFFLKDSVLPPLRVTGRTADVLLFEELRREGFPKALKMLEGAVRDSLSRSSA